MRITHKLRYLAPTLFGLLLGVGTPAAALDLAQKPLFTFLTAPPNVLVAIDNSGSMDFEVQFPTDSGLLYWDSDRWDGITDDTLVPLLNQTGETLGILLGQDPGKTQDGNNQKANPGFATDADGKIHYYTTSKALESTDDSEETNVTAKRLLVPYGYLFPNGCNNGARSGKRVFCKSEGNGLLPNVTDPLSIVTGLLGLPLSVNNPELKLLPLLLGEDQKFIISAVPPIPQFGFARSPAHNNAYFDPSADYNPWPGYTNAPKTAAPSNPLVDNQKFNLTLPVRNDEKFWRFRVDVGMVLPAGTEISFGPLLEGDKPLLNVLNFTTELLGGVLGNVLGPICKAIGDTGILQCPSVLNQVLGLLGSWHTLGGNWTVGEPVVADALGYNCEANKGGLLDDLGAPEPDDNGGGFFDWIGDLLSEITNFLTDTLGLSETISDILTNENSDFIACNEAIGNLLTEILLPLDLGIKYFPATFYLPDGATLPDGYGYDGDAPLIGYAPGKTPGTDEPTLRRYQIKPLNFKGGANGEYYKRAIENFANWFTYYRKRHLAVRAGIARAVEASTGKMNMGIVATNSIADNDGPKSSVPNITIRENAPKSAASEGITDNIYSDIYEINFAKPRLAPNRGALAYLGQQFADLDTGNTEACRANYAVLATDGYSTGTVSGFGDADGDGTSDTIADVAKYYYVQDVPVTTHGIVPGPKNLTRLRGDQIDDLQAAADNSYGEVFSALQPEKIAEALHAIVVEGPSKASGTKIEVERTYVSDSSPTHTYQAFFDYKDWNGDLVATDSDGNIVWSAAEKLAKMEPKDRIILTTVRSNCGKGNDNKHTAFFGYIPLKNGCETLDPNEVAYIRGDQSNEKANGGIFRDRPNGILGDIVHSNPLHVGAPNRLRYPAKWRDSLYPDQDMAENWGKPNTYGRFIDNHDERTSIVYVGANDGMLHGFNAETGVEELAYVPYAALDSLKSLTNPSYTHEYYVDGSPVAGDVVFDGDQNGTPEWHTVLVGGLRGGGKSIYAVNITKPSEFSVADTETDAQNAEKIVLWEFVHEELGYTYGKPAIVRLHNGEWAAIFGNGYNSTSGTARLFIVGIDPDYKFANGKRFVQIDTKIGTNSDPTLPDGAGATNGLGPVFPVDLDGDFITDYVYAGDLQGNVWKFDLTSDSTGSWSANKLFQATDPSGNPQPITTQPQVGASPLGLDHGVMVYFGTGKYLEEGDPEASPQNAFYGIWDPEVFTTPNGIIPEDATDNGLVRNTVGTGTGGDGNTYRVVSSDENKTVDYRPADGDYTRGWVVPLNADKEQVITNARLQDNTVVFSTLVPGVGAACGASGGGFFMVLDRFNGAVGTQPIFDTDGDGDIDSKDKITVNGSSGFASGLRIDVGIPGAVTYQVNRDSGEAYYIVPTSSGETVTIGVPLLGADGRVSWREIRR